MPRGGGGRSSGGSSRSSSSSGGRGFFGSRSPARGTTAAARPPPVQQRPPMQQATPSAGGGMMSGMGGMVMTGMALGAGSAIGHEAVRGLMGSGSGHGSQQNEPAQQQQQQNYAQPMEQGYAPAEYGQQQMVQQQQQNPCMGFNMNFLNCLKSSANEISLCQFQMDQLMSCEKDNMKFHGI